MSSMFFGIIYLDKRVIERKLLTHSEKTIAQWQPDKCHIWHQNSVGFLQQQRFNTPQSKHLSLPIKNAREQYFLCGQTRIDNRHELCDQLGLLEQDKHTITDEYLILKAYERWEYDAPNHLLGDYVFIIWDKPKRQFFLARDILGTQCLYYHYQQGRHFIFANTPHPIIHCSLVPITLSERTLAYDLALLSGGACQGSYYQDVETLKPAHHYILDAKKISAKQYWTPHQIKSLRYKQRSEYYEHFQSIFQTAVKSRLRSDYSIASHLSGGFDSSSVTAVAAKLLQQDNKSLLAYSYIPAHQNKTVFTRPGRTADDSIYIDAVASLYPNIKLFKTNAPDDCLFENVKKLHTYLGSPFLDNFNVLWIKKIYQLASQSGCRTLLTGQMGNFTISWSNPYPNAKAFLKNRCKIFLLERLLNQLIMRKDPIKANTLASQQLVQPYRNTKIMFPLFPLKTVADYITFLINNLNMGGHYAFFASIYGIHTVDPTADQRIIEFCHSIPRNIFYDKKLGHRMLVKGGLKDVLPESLLYRTTRGAQMPEWYYVFDKKLHEFKLIALALKQSSYAKYFDNKELEHLLNTWYMPHTQVQQRLIPKLEIDYRFKVVHALSTYLFISQLHNNARQKQALENKKHSWHPPQITRVHTP